MISVVMQTSQSDKEGLTEEELNRAKENASLQGQAVKIEQQIEEEKKRLAKENKTASKLAQTQTQIDLLKKQLASQNEIKKKENEVQQRMGLAEILCFWSNFQIIGSLNR